VISAVIYLKKKKPTNAKEYKNERNIHLPTVFYKVWR